MTNYPLYMQDEAVIQGRVLRWGNSYGVRLHKKDAIRMGLEPGRDISLKILPEGKRKQALARFPLFSDPDPDTSLKHDEYLGEARLARLKRRQDEKRSGS